MINETFVQPSNVNNDELDKESTKTLYERETQEIKKILHQRINKQDYPRDYKTFYLMDILFEKSQFKEYIKKKIQMVFDEYVKGTLLEYTKMINNIYKVYTNKDFYRNRLNIIFSIDATNVKAGFTRELLVYMYLNNVNNYISESGETYPILGTIYDDLEIIYIRPIEMDKEMEVEFSMGSLEENHYNIKNRMSYIKSEFSTMDITSDDKKEFNKQLKERESKIIFRDAKCFNGKGESREECIKNMGIWDSQPKENVECPYYKANDNYPNTFGGIRQDVVGNVCELPRNMKKVGYTGYGKGLNDIPLCYNCKYNNIGVGTLGYCCDDQIKNKDVYSNLIGPDYAYINDNSERKKWSSLFLENNLSVD
jgi:hypothetical protein